MIIDDWRLTIINKKGRALRIKTGLPALKNKKHSRGNPLECFKSLWRPQGDSNPCRRRERPVSWTGLDDGDGYGRFLVGRVGLEPTTLCLKGRYSTG